MRVLVMALAVAACGAGTRGGDDEVGGDGGGSTGSSRVVVQIVEQRFGQPATRNGSASVAIALFDSRTHPICGETVLFEGGGCRVTGFATPPCSLTCGANEFCYVDAKDSCQQKCFKQCTQTCADGSYCTREDETCRPIESYEAAGAITMTGLATPTTLVAPDYPFTIFSNTVYAGGEVRAKASGAGSIGIAAFEVALSPPPDVVASPPLSSLTAVDLDGDLPLAWAAGTDQIEIDLFAAGTGVSMRGKCTSNDDGGFTIPAGVFAAFPAATMAVRIDLKRVREARATTTGFGFWLGATIPGPAEAVLRLVRLETNTIAI